MVETILEQPFKLIVVTEPTVDEFKKIAKEYNLHENSVEDCLEPEHLPKIEKFEKHYFYITRYFDTECDEKADITQELTRKIAMFISGEFLIVVMRVRPVFWNRIIDELKASKHPMEAYCTLMYRSIESYQQISDQSSNSLEQLEARMFHQNTGNTTLKRIHLIKRRLTVIKHIFAQIQIMIAKTPSDPSYSTFLQDLREEQEVMSFKINSLIEESTTLFQLYLSVSSNRTNEIMRLLTVMSVFFMPLNFFAGVYGMNFTHLPGADSPKAFWVACGVFISTGIAVFLWFRAKKLLK